MRFQNSFITLREHAWLKGRDLEKEKAFHRESTSDALIPALMFSSFMKRAGMCAAIRREIEAARASDVIIWLLQQCHGRSFLVINARDSPQGPNDVSFHPTWNRRLFKEKK